MSEKRWFTVVTDAGTIRTYATSPCKARWNAKYRLAMADRGYAKPRPQDLAVMRDIQIVDIQDEREMAR